ncbi:hypothetical protein [Cyclobacterium jeungdonense]|uniref:Porin n=1 Tax=Cyclobacterium jeungdonense TaxID=708087 RepID=A0ABT8C476_9BACT|nr:hypothetical protein [Cyclobacterium jeungdonense]MDN3687578.1 hypothetical protein [Cyclobacterium jeungdonense]
MKGIVKLIVVIYVSIVGQTFSQSLKKKDKDIPNSELKFKLNENGSNYVKFTFLNQVWIRSTQNNPGSTVDGYSEEQTFDIGLRRTRLQVYGQLTDRVFFYTQFGTNNLSYVGTRKQGLFFHDALGELKVVKDHLSIGTGLTGWNGLSRYSSPSVGSILSLDAPLYQQATNDVTDQFLRKYSIYAKGKIGILDYRVAVSKPMTVENTAVQGSEPMEYALFSARPPNPQFHGYLMFQFLDKESNLTPYNTGSYLGKKRVFNLGAGFLYQKDAMWFTQGESGPVQYDDLGLLAFDVFYDQPLNQKTGTALTAYASLHVDNYGKDYIRNLGVMNPTNGVVPGQGSFNGAGNAFPMIGTGKAAYFQTGYLFPKNLLKGWGTLQPFIASQFANWDRLNDSMLMYEYGINWLINGNATKMSLNYQSRPVFDSVQEGIINQTDRKGMLVLQFQVAI